MLNIKEEVIMEFVRLLNSLFDLNPKPGWHPSGRAFEFTTYSSEVELDVKPVVSYVSK